MGLLAPLAALLGLEVENVVARARATTITYATIAIMVLVAVVFLLVAGYLALSEIYGGIFAALIIGGVFLLLALIVYMAAQAGHRRRQREHAEKRRSSETGAFLTTAALTAVPALLRSPLVVKLGLPVAAIAAVALLRDRRDPP